MKKILSIALALALCLTAMMGCFVVSAAANTLTVGNADITVGETATVDVVLASEGVWAVRFDVVADATVTAVSIDDPNFVADLEGTKVLIQSLKNDYTTELTNATITLTFADLAVGTYNVAIENIDAGNYAEAAVAFTATAGTIVVADEVVVPECDHEWDVVSAVAATESANGSIDFACAKCAETKTETVAYHARYTFNYYVINMAQQIELIFNLRTSRIADQGDAEDVFVQKIVAAATGDETTYVEDVLDMENVTVSGNPCKPIAVSVAAKQLVDDLTAIAFVKYNGVWYSGEPKTKSVAQRCHELYSQIGETEKALYANLLTYGSKAQTYFDYKVDTLADADLAGYASYVTAENPVLADDRNNDYTDPCIRYYNYHLSMAAKTEAVLYFRTDKMADVAISQVTAKASYVDGAETIANTYGEADFIAPPNESRAGRYAFSYDGVYPKYMRKTVTVKFAVDGVDTNSTLTFSIAGLAGNLINGGTVKGAEADMYYAMINYADAAAAHFGTAA